MRGNDIVLQEDGKEDIDYKTDHRFADVMQDKNEAVSDFATTRTIAQQRQYLPIFAVRNEVGLITRLYPNTLKPWDT